MLAERSAHAHVANDRAGDARRETIRSPVATGTVLLKDTIAFVLRFRVVCGGSDLLVGRRCGSLCVLRMILRRSLRVTVWTQRYRGQDKESGKVQMLRIHGHFPFQAGKRKR